MIEQLFKKDKQSKELLDNLWMDLGDVTKIKTPNPFAVRSTSDIENPHIFLLKLLRNPDYFGFTCKHIFNVELLPFQLAIMKELWYRPFPILVMSRGASKTYSLAMYALLRALFTQGSKIVIVGGGFRQAKHVFEYCENIWRQAPIFQDILGGGKRDRPKYNVDRCTFKVGDSVINALPLGNGDKIRGERATHLITDEFSVVNPDIYETVVSGFAAVTQSPDVNVKERARLKYLKEIGAISEQDFIFLKSQQQHNQQIIAGTAYYQFEHFYRYYDRQRKIIESGGDKDKLAEIFEGHDKIPQGFNYKDFSIIRIPIELIPDGFMDERNIARSQATAGTSIYRMEFQTIWVSDSDGFFNRRLIESCVVGKPQNNIVMPSCGPVYFTSTTVGSPKYKYVYGIDPASEMSNFAVTVLEVHPDHRRVVCVWTTTRSKQKRQLKLNLTAEENFYVYVAKKIRKLMKVFPCEAIAMDSQGGGYSVLEALGDRNTLEEGEKPIYEVIDPDKEKDTDFKVGHKIVHLISFVDAQWTALANHSLKKDLGDKSLLFPYFDPISISLAAEEDLSNGKRDAVDDDLISVYDTLEDCVIEIEELKTELTTIVHSSTPSGREHWDVPHSKLPGHKRGRLRKDRYSALLMANMVARSVNLTGPEIVYDEVGGLAKDMARGKSVEGDDGMYYAPEWFTNSQYTDGLSLEGVINNEGVDRNSRFHRRR